MRHAIIWCVAALIGLIVASPARAQYYLPADPCASPAAPGYRIMLPPDIATERAIACQRQRDAAVRQQQAAIEAEQMRQYQAQRQAALAVAAAEAREQAHQAAVAAAEVAMESSSDNICRHPDTARILMEEYNGMDWPVPRKALDIEHLVTVRQDAASATMVCHGVFVHSNGEKLEGTITLHPNVAGDIIVEWKPEHWEPEVSDWVQPQAAPVVAPAGPVAAPPVNASAAPVSPAASAFDQGLADRKAWEMWFNATSGDYRTGALYWTSQRSLAHPGSCAILGGDGTAGCTAAQARLAVADSRRHSEPDYRQGWNSYVPP